MFPNLYPYHGSFKSQDIDIARGVRGQRAPPHEVYPSDTLNAVKNDSHVAPTSLSATHTQPPLPPHYASDPILGSEILLPVRPASRKKKILILGV